MKHVGIYIRAFPRISEAFISEQAQNLTRHQPIIIANTILKATPFPHISLSESDCLGIKQTLFSLTRNPNLFSHSNNLSKLALIHAHFGPDGVYALPLANKLRIPLIVTFHGYDITISREAIWRTRKFSYYQLILHEKQLQQDAAAFIAVSRHIRQKLIEQGYPEDKIILHHIGTDTNKFTPTSKKPEERYILCVGRHIQKKGIATLLRAFARIAAKHPDISLIQVGSGPMTAELQMQANKLGINSRVRFLGAQPHERVLELMRGAEVFSLPSQTADNGDCEGLPIVLNEASACGVPIISTWHSGIPEAVADGETGFLVKEKDDLALADKLDILLSNYALGRKMGQRGREMVCERFDISRQTSKLEAIYDRLIGDRSAQKELVHTNEVSLSYRQK